MSNNNIRPIIFLLIVTVAVVCLRFIPQFTICGYKVKTIDFLSDLVTKHTFSTNSEEFNLITNKPKLIEYNCPEGVTCIEDYGQETPFGRTTFYNSLSQTKSLNRPVRIAYFGDSFIEGDILTADLRELLQKEFGGCGVGYLSIAPESPGFRKSITQYYDNWDAHQVTNKEDFDSKKQSIAQTYAYPNNKSYIQVVATDKYSCATQFEKASFYLISDYPVSLNVTINNNEQRTITSQGLGELEALTINGNFNQLKWDIECSDSLQTKPLCHGIALEGNKGVVIDNFAMRSTSGTQLLSLDKNYLKQLNKIRTYDLIILHYGLNVANKNTNNYDSYVVQMSHLISKLKECFPRTSILISSVGDREDKIDGELHTMPCVLSMIQYQQKLAIENEIAFWNFYKAMGGEGSIVKMAEKSPAEARTDYTHITHEGGKPLAEIYFKALMAGYEQYKISEE